MIRVFMPIAVTFTVVYAGVCIALFCYQRSLIYFPQQASFGNSTSTSSIHVPGADLVSSVRPVSGPYALIYFGGNAEDVSINLPEFSVTFPEHSLFLMHYRGYGGSSGSPTEEALHADALALFDKVHGEHSSIVVIGRSLGTGVAVRLASERPVSRLVLVTPYCSLMELAEQQFPYIPVRWLLEDKFESWRYAPQVTAPTTIVIAENDEVVPTESSNLLFSSFRKGIATSVVIAAAGHNTVSASRAYLPALAHVRLMKPVVHKTTMDTSRACCAGLPFRSLQPLMLYDEPRPDASFCGRCMHE